MTTAIIPLALTLVLSCVEEPSGRKPETPQPQPEPELPELSLVGGAQDLWPFDFGFDATRAAVATEFGDPSERNTVPVGANRDSGASDGDSENGSTGVVESWRYEGVSFDFFIDPEQNLEFLLSAQVSDSSIVLGSGISIGMEVDDLFGIMGEPAVSTERNLVYFYLTNTIEFHVGEDRVAAVTLSRAMP